jgi:hypothetical protein
MILTNFFLHRKLRRLKRASARRTHSYRSLADVRYVMVMCEARDWKTVEPCIAKLKAMGKTVHPCIYTRKQDETPIWDYACLLVEAGKDINIWGFPDRKVQEQLRGLTIDLLLDLTGSPQPVMQYLMLLQPSAFKAGAKYPADEDMYDFAIIMKDGVHDITYLFNQIINYLQVIRSG